MSRSSLISTPRARPCWPASRTVSSVMTNTWVTLAETGIADAINDGGGRWESARNKMFALDFATQAQEMKAIGGQPDYALGSVHAVTPDGTLVIASASGSRRSSRSTRNCPAASTSSSSASRSATELPGQRDLPSATRQ